jgi:hypothetical protein
LNKGTTEGIEEEIKFVKELNSNKESKIWLKLGISLDRKKLFAIHVTGHKWGKINESKIKPKADVYIAYGDINPEYVKQKDFYLTESDVEKFKLRKIEFSGISIKRADSERYQILKMNPSTFKKVFGSFELGAGASIYCKRKEELNKNSSVLKGWQTNWKKFEKFFYFIPEIEKLNDVNTNPNTRLEIAKKVKEYATKKIEEIIHQNEEISKFVFQGIGNFEEPYTANWLYEKGEIKKAGPMPFVVTTGSGRSHGDFTIVVKPK